MNSILKMVLLLLVSCGVAFPAAEAEGNAGPALFPIWNAQHKTGYIDVTGKVVIQPIFDNGSDFSEGLAAVSLGGKWGFIDTTGKFIVAPAFYAASPFSDGLAAVYEFGAPVRKCGYIDHTGRFVIPLQLKFSCKAFNEGFAVVDIYNEEIGESLSGYLDKSGATPIGSSFVFAGDFSMGLALVHDSSKRIFIDRSGNKVIDLSEYGGTDTLSDQYEPSGPFSEGLAEVGIKIFSQYGYNRYGFVNRRGKIVFQLPSELTVKGAFHEGRALVLHESTERVKITLGDGEVIRMTEQVARFGFINLTGRVVIPARFRDGVDFFEGLAAVLNGSPKALNQRDLAGSAAEGAMASNEGVWQCIDASGKVQIARCGTPISQETMQKNFPLLREGVGSGFVNGLFFTLIPTDKDMDESVQSKAFGYMNKAGKYVWISSEAEKRVTRGWLQKNLIGRPGH